MSLWKKTCLSVLFFILFLAGIIFYLIFTSNGINLIFNNLNILIPEIKIDQVKGYWDNLIIEKIFYKNKNISIYIGECNISFDIKSLIKKKVVLNKLSLTDVSIILNLKKKIKLKELNQEINNHFYYIRNYPIVIKNITVNNFDIKINDYLFSLRKILSDVFLQGNNININYILIYDLIINLSKKTNFFLKTILSYKYNNIYLDKLTFIKKIKYFLIKNNILFKKDIFFTPLNINKKKFKTNNINILKDSKYLCLYKIYLEINFFNKNIHLKNLNINSDIGNMYANIYFNLNNVYSLDIDLTLVSRLIKNYKVILKVKGALLDKISVFVDIYDLFNMNCIANIQLTKFGLPMNIELISNSKLISVINNKKYKLENLKFKVFKKKSNLNFLMMALVKENDMLPIYINLNLQGNNKEINLNKLIINYPKGKIKLMLFIKHDKEISWNGQFNINHLSTYETSMIYPFKINGTIQTEGIVSDSIFLLRFPKINFLGNLNKKILKIKGIISYDGQLKSITQNLNIILGCNNVNVKGEIGINSLNFNTIMYAPDLNGIIPKFSGKINTLLKLKGNLKYPHIITNIDINDLIWKKLSISNLHLDANIKYFNQIQGRLRFLTKNFIYHFLYIKNGEIEITGNEKKHNLKLEMCENNILNQIHLTGNLDRNKNYWKGRFNQINFSTVIGTLKSIYPFELLYQYRDNKIIIGENCWNNKDIKICLSKIVYYKSQIITKLNVNYFNLNIFEPFLSKNIRLNGIFVGKLDITWNLAKNRLSYGNLILSGYNIKLILIDNIHPILIKSNFIKMIANSNKKQSELIWFINLTNKSYFNGKIKIYDPYENYNPNINGSINIKNFDLEINNSILSTLNKAKSIISANLYFSGNFSKPKIFGKIKFDSLSLKSKFIPFNLNKSNLLFNFNGTNSIIDGLFYNKEEKISITGNISWNKIKNWYAKILLKSKLINVNLTSTTNFSISPNITFEVKPNLFNIYGNIDIPSGKFIIYKFPKKTINISNDEVLIDKNKKITTYKSIKIPVCSNINLNIGNNVLLDVFGLKAKIKGNLKILKNRQNLNLNGQINISEGNLNIYGQNLIVRKGELILSGPTDQSFINVEAIRNPETTKDNMIVGIRILGTGYEPKIEIFSDQNISKQEALSYLLRGQQLENNQNDSAFMTSILFGLGISKSNHFLYKIGNLLGINNLAITNYIIGDTSQLVVSGYLLPNLQISYGLKLTDSLMTFTLRYNILPNLYLEATSGTNKTLNLIYQFNF